MILAKYELKNARVITRLDLYILIHLLCRTELRQVEVTLSNHMLSLVFIEHDYLELRGFRHECISASVELQGSFHLKFVANFDRTVLGWLRPGVDVFAASQPQHHERDTIRCILQE